MQAKHMPILGCNYQSAPDDKAVPPLYACTFCGHLTTTPKVHRFQACESRQQGANAGEYLPCHRS